MKTSKVTNSNSSIVNASILSAHGSKAATSSPYSRQVLADTPARALAFLGAIGKVSEVRAAMNAEGYTDDDHDAGWALLNSVSGRHTPIAASNADALVAAAIKALETFNNGGFRRLRAALERCHPEEGDFVFGGLEIAHELEAVQQIGLFLQRLNELENGKGRKGTRKADHAALATLEKRGMTKAIRAHLAGQVKLAESPPKAEVKTPEDVAQDQADLVALRAWYNDWAETARGVITQRRLLMRMGLAQRRVKEKATPPAPVGPVVPVVPVVPVLPATTVTPVTPPPLVVMPIVSAAE